MFSPDTGTFSLNQAESVQAAVWTRARPGTHVALISGNLLENLPCSGFLGIRVACEASQGFVECHNRHQRRANATVAMFPGQPGCGLGPGVVLKQIAQD